MNFLVIKAVEIDCVRAINGHFAGIDEIRDRTDQTEILVLIIMAERRRKQNQRQPAAISEGEHFEITAEPRRVPFDITFVHLKNRQ